MSCNHMEKCSDTMAFALSKFVSVPSISGNPAHREDCRQAAIWLRKCLGQLGARTSLVGLIDIYQNLFDVVQLPTGDGNNPLVLATFEGSIDAKPKPRILFYGYRFSSRVAYFPY
jgi:di- and tripeptidase